MTYRIAMTVRYADGRDVNVTTTFVGCKDEMDCERKAREVYPLVVKVRRVEPVSKLK